MRLEFLLGLVNKTYLLKVSIILITSLDNTKVDSQEMFCLKWKSYDAHMDLFHENKFSAVTLVCDDQKQLQAHKIVVSACSPVFPTVYVQGEGHYLTRQDQSVYGCCQGVRDERAQSGSQGSG